MLETRTYWVIGLILAYLSPRELAWGQVSSLDAAAGAILQHNTQSWSLPSDQKPTTSQPANEIPFSEDPSQALPVETAPSEQPVARNDSLEIFVRDIHLEGNTVLDATKVEAVLRLYKNRALNFSDMQALTEKMNALYRENGYINSRVIIPMQDFSEQTLKLKALEAKVGEILYEPARWYPKRGVVPRIALQSGDVLNIRPLSRSIRLVNENPDLMLQARLAKGKVAQTSDILIKGQSRFPVHLTPFMDNLGRRSIGNLRMGLSGIDNNLFGFGDITTTVVSFTRSSYGLVEQYTIPIGRYGTRIGMNYAYSNVKLGGSLKPLNIHSRSHIFTPLIVQPLWKTERSGLNVSLGFDFKNLNTDVLDDRFHEDRLRVLRPGIDGYWNDRWGRTYLNHEFGIGLDILGGKTGNSSLASRSGAGTKFFSMTGGLTRVQRLPWGTTGVLRARYQYSPNRLLSAEQFQIGGAYTVRGYSEGLQLGDSGYLWNAEWYVPAFVIPPKWHLPFFKQPLRQVVQLVGFSDFGENTINKPTSGQARYNHMLSCGLGLRIQLNRLLIARADLGFPLLRQNSNELRPRIHIGLQSTLF